MITRWDKIIIIFVLVLAIGSYIVFSFLIFGEQAESVEIYVNGTEYATYNLVEIKENKIIDIETELGHNLIEISNKGAKMIDASCPDKTDIKSGEITKPGQIIICVPNRVSVKIIGKSKSNVDKVTY